MPKLPILSSKELIKVLKKIGFGEAPRRGKGSHHAFVKKTSEQTYLVIIPIKKEIPRGTLLSIIEQAGLSKDEFIKLL
ncbi:MAG: type II toxin-antitoxin system HicA family toxin [Acidobacteria bacterium]|nr:type II toxin-antitoxin system HicA family toxin [Acidobacteriota bacterium]MBU4493820.1 type II toxin-antitoxin system HicA family toxin [Acidobacteriota bacterium]MCG2816209.1 type II toxin-antitoxin system HicA family toxin [Candidatus Aminicenantes bacterium]